MQEPPTASDANAGSTMSNHLALGAGCYWGTEKFVKKDFQKRFPKSILNAKVGFMSPYETPKYRNPTYEQVCRGDSDHVEVLYIELKDPEQHFEELLRFFFSFHDPTTLNRQGNDRGFQYASYIFFSDDRQKEIAQRVKSEMQELLDTKQIRTFHTKHVLTEVARMRKFTQAREDHQQYLAKNPFGYCNHRIRFKKWPAKKETEEKQQ